MSFGRSACFGVAHHRPLELGETALAERGDALAQVVARERLRQPSGRSRSCPSSSPRSWAMRSDGEPDAPLRRADRQRRRGHDPFDQARRPPRPAPAPAPRRVTRPHAARLGAAHGSRRVEQVSPARRGPTASTRRGRCRTGSRRRAGPTGSRTTRRARRPPGRTPAPAGIRRRAPVPGRARRPGIGYVAIARIASRNGPSKSGAPAAPRSRARVRARRGRRPRRSRRPPPARTTRGAGRDSAASRRTRSSAPPASERSARSAGRRGPA